MHQAYNSFHSLILDKRQSSVRMGRSLVNLLLQSAFGEALPKTPGHVSNVNAVVRLVVLQTDAFPQSLRDLNVIC